MPRNGGINIDPELYQRMEDLATGKQTFRKLTLPETLAATAQFVVANKDSLLGGLFVHPEAPLEAAFAPFGLLFMAESGMITSIVVPRYATLQEARADAAKVIDNPPFENGHWVRWVQVYGEGNVLVGEAIGKPQDPPLKS